MAKLIGLTVVADLADQAQRKLAVCEAVLLLYAARRLIAGAQQCLSAPMGPRWLASTLHQLSDAFADGAWKVYQAELHRRWPRRRGSPTGRALGVTGRRPNGIGNHREPR